MYLKYLYKKILTPPVYGNTGNKQSILKNNDGSSTEFITWGREITYSRTAMATATTISGKLSNGTNYLEVASYGINRLEDLDKCSLGKLGSFDDSTVDGIVNEFVDNTRNELGRMPIRRKKRAARGAFESFIYKRYKAMTGLSPHAKDFLPDRTFMVSRRAHKVDGPKAYIKYDEVNYVECYYSSLEAYIAGKEPILVCLCLDGRTGAQSILRRMETGNYIDHGTIRPSDGKKPKGYDEYSTRYYRGSDVQELQAGGITADAVPFSVIKDIIREAGFKDISEEMRGKIEEIARSGNYDNPVEKHAHIPVANEEI